MIETLRLYAAARDGKVPASLMGVKDVPVPIDPGTGKEFEYRIKDDQAVLTWPPLGSETQTAPFAFVDELTFKRGRGAFYEAIVCGPRFVTGIRACHRRAADVRRLDQAGAPNW